MTAISIKQPWLFWIVAGDKTIETRSWKTNYRGLLLLCSSRTIDNEAVYYGRSNGWRMPKDSIFQTGLALATCDLLDCRPMERIDEMDAKCRWEPGRFAWILGNVTPLSAPFPVKGSLGLFEKDMP